MVKFNRFLANLVGSPKEGKWRKVVLAPLCLLSFFYGRMMAARVFLYSKRIFRSQALPCKVVSVGNITLGGTGKTPFACLIAEMVRGRGYRAAILSRGYGGKFKEPFRLVSDEEHLLMEVREAGDEPYLLAERLKGIPVIVGRRRWAAGRFALEKFGSQVIILDDGFQHLALKRDLDLLLIDSAALFGNGCLIPRGVLREPLSQLSRANAFILTKVDQSGNISNLKENLVRGHQDRPVFRVTYAPEKILVYGKETFNPVQTLKGKRVLAFCGIARPESFGQILLSLKTQIIAQETFPDHYWYGPKDWERLFDRAKYLKADALVTTEKDLVRLKNLCAKPESIPLWAICIRHVFPEGDQEQFEKFFFSRLGLENASGNRR